MPVPNSAVMMIDPSVIDTDPTDAIDVASLDALMTSIESLGILQPVLVRQRGRTGRFEIVAGRRRLRAARALDLQTLPALVVAPDTPDSFLHQAAMAENNVRSANLRSDLIAIERLVADGMDADAIADTLGMPRATVLARLRLTRLHTTLREWFIAGVFGGAVAELLSRLSMPSQTNLVARFRGEPSAITASVAREARRAERPVVLTQTVTVDLAAPSPEAEEDDLPTTPAVEGSAATSAPQWTGMPTEPSWGAVVAYLSGALQMLPMETATTGMRETTYTQLTTMMTQMRGLIR